jgi:hypothetical protein
MKIVAVSNPAIVLKILREAINQVSWRCIGRAAASNNPTIMNGTNIALTGSQGAPIDSVISDELGADTIQSEQGNDALRFSIALFFHADRRRWYSIATVDPVDRHIRSLLG